VTIRDQAQIRLQPPPSSITDVALRTYLQQITDAVNTMPRLSVFSYSTPESNVTASTPTLGFNLASGVSRLWTKVSGDTSIGWNPLA